MATHIVLYVVRHGETALNAKNAFRGPINVSLSPKGVKQARKVGRILSKKPITSITTSGKKRTNETAKEIVDLQEKSLPIKHNSSLQAWNLGDFAGKPKDKENLIKLKKYIDNPSDVVPRGESLSDFQKRVKPAIKQALALGQAGRLPLLVVHSSVIHEIGKIINHNEASALVKPGGIVIVIKKPNGKLVAKPILYPTKPNGELIT